ncbi:MAG: Methyltransferase domain protein [Crocinitomicaceae bacterium]|jgi:SAM-dependent methyltransferase|nr:Methyltransferase domain protein [Crocinitomicaceae bacterium]
MKDNFSTHSADYARYRPTYPDAFYTWLGAVLTERGRAWDCGTGNGQVAGKLAELFREVCATDLSQKQLDEAVQRENIQYSCQTAEQTNFPVNFFDLVVVAQAIHWFDFDRFYAEVRRTAKKDALLIVLGYGLLRISPEVDAVVRRFHDKSLAPYWDPERRYIDENYQTIPFPFEEIPAPAFTHELDWTVEQLIAYIQTWSAVKHYAEKQGSDPVELIRDELKQAWGEDDHKKVSFPILLRVGKVD